MVDPSALHIGGLRSSLKSACRPGVTMRVVPAATSTMKQSPVGSGWLGRSSISKLYGLVVNASRSPSGDQLTGGLHQCNTRDATVSRRPIEMSATVMSKTFAISGDCTTPVIVVNAMRRPVGDNQYRMTDVRRTIRRTAPFDNVTS